MPETENHRLCWWKKAAYFNMKTKRPFWASRVSVMPSLSTCAFPRDWLGFKVDNRNGNLLRDKSILLVDDGQQHAAHVVIGTDEIGH
jgi:hypothetical protein